MSEAQDLAERLAAWGTYHVERPLLGGHRNRVYLVRAADDTLWIAKTTRRSEAALARAHHLQCQAAEVGLGVAAYRKSDAGLFGLGGLTVEPFIEGQPSTATDMAGLRAGLAKLRQATASWRHRPGFAGAADLLSGTHGGDINLSAMPDRIVAACRGAWTALQTRRETAIHGDLSPANLIRAQDGRLILIDWDEARRDTPLFDHAALSPNRMPRALAQAHLAWEVASGWQTEPDHARILARRLLQGSA